MEVLFAIFSVFGGITLAYILVYHIVANIFLLSPALIAYYHEGKLRYRKDFNKSKSRKLILNTLFVFLLSWILIRNHPVYSADFDISFFSGLTLSMFIFGICVLLNLNSRRSVTKPIYQIIRDYFVRKTSWEGLLEEKTVVDTPKDRHEALMLMTPFQRTIRKKISEEELVHILGKYGDLQIDVESRIRLVCLLKYGKLSNDDSSIIIRVAFVKDGQLNKTQLTGFLFALFAFDELKELEGYSLNAFRNDLNRFFFIENHHKEKKTLHLNDLNRFLQERL